MAVVCNQRGAIGPALIARLESGRENGWELQKRAALSTAVFGWPAGYDYGEQTSALKELDALRKAGRPLTDLSQKSFDSLAKGNSSFANPTFTTITSLRNAGIPVQAYSVLDDSVHDAVRRVASDRNVGSVIQIGAMLPENAEILARSGKHFGRLATDYGSGGFLQPRYHFDGAGSTGGLNGMYIDPSIRYDSVYVPGGDLRKWRGIPSSAKVVPTGRLATSPLFGLAGFNQNHSGPAKALMITGGGSGMGMPLEYKTLGDLGRTTDRSVMHAAPNTLDHILDALRQKYGNNFRLDYLTGINPAEANAALTPEAYSWLFDKAKSVSKSPDITVWKDMWALKNLLDPSSAAYRQVSGMPGGEKFLQRLATRYRGLNLVPRVGLPDMARYYGGADMIFDLPGSSLGEIASMRGEKTPGMIHIVPRENEYYPRHFRGNALVTNQLMQPGARHNIVSVASPTFREDIAKAVAESGFKDWGRRPIMSTQEAMAPLVNDIRRANRIRELKMLASPSGIGNRLAKGLWRAARFIR